jgi:hypothetical protein
LSDLLRLFANNLLPLLLIVGCAYFLNRQFHLNPRPISQIAFYIFSPALIFVLIVENNLSNTEILKTALFPILLTLVMGVITFLVGRGLHFDRRTLAAVMLTTLFMNAGNYGLSVNLFAFGENALAYASIFFVTMAVLMNTLGVVIASLGSATLKQALTNLLKVPTLYALILGVIVLRSGWQLPLPLERSVNLLADAAIPTLMVLLGLSLKTVRWDGNKPALLIVNSLRLVIAPLIAIALCSVFQIQGYLRQAVILESAMPAAILNTAIATEFNLDPGLVSASILTTTLVSVFTITPLLAYLGG